MHFRANFEVRGGKSVCKNICCDTYWIFYLHKLTRSVFILCGLSFFSLQCICQSWKHCLCTGSKSKGWPWPCNNSIFATCFQLRRLMITFFLHLQKPPKGPHPPKVISKPPIVPDFDKSYQSFLRSMKMKKMSKPTTVIQPFSFDDEIDVRFFFLIFSVIASFISGVTPTGARGL